MTPHKTKPPWEDLFNDLRAVLDKHGVEIVYVDYEDAGFSDSYGLMVRDAKTQRPIHVFPTSFISGQLLTKLMVKTP